MVVDVRDVARHLVELGARLKAVEGKIENAEASSVHRHGRSHYGFGLDEVAPGIQSNGTNQPLQPRLNFGAGYPITQTANLKRLNIANPTRLDNAGGSVVIDSNGRITITPATGTDWRAPADGRPLIFDVSGGVEDDMDGALIRTSAQYSAEVTGAEYLTLVKLDAKNTAASGTAQFYMVNLIMDCDTVDTGAALRIRNDGRADAIYIDLKGKASPTASSPTGIGLDMNRDGNLTTGYNANMTGTGIHVWDWSSADFGITGPRGLYLYKRNNANSQHLLADVQANRNAFRFLVDSGLAGYTAGDTLIRIDDNNGGATLAQIRNTGEFRARGNSATIISYSFQGDADSGVYNPSADTVGLVAGGTERWRMTTAALVPQQADNTLDLGSSALRVRDGYYGTSLRVGTTVASAGAIRLANAAILRFRNAADSADLAGIQATSSNVIQVGESGGSTQIHGTTIGMYGVTPVGRQTYLETNVTTDRAFDADSVTLPELADVVGTMIADVRAFGVWI